MSGFCQSNGKSSFERRSVTCMAMNTYENGASESRDDELRRTILDFIQNYVDNDPLEPYLRCIKWLKEMNPPGSVKVVLQEVLELAAKNFVPDKRYKSDLRYLKVWIQYADCCLERGGIFPFLEANGIGLEHGLFYEAYAMLLESSREYSKADYVFQIGISRGAQPLERVIAMHNNFRSRMVARQRRKLRQEQEQKALLSRLSGGAMRPLADNHGMEGLPIMPPFQSNAREDPLLDMQVSAGGRYGGPAPVLIGSHIYECKGLQAESSFEEERVRHWIQKKPPSTLFSPSTVSNNNEQVIPNPLKRDITLTRLNEVHDIPGNRPGTVTTDSSTHYQLPAQREVTPNGYIPDFTPMGASNEFSGVENVSMKPVTTHSDVAAVHSSAHRSEKPFTNETGVERPAAELLDDVSMVTKSVTDDIMAMFGDPAPTETRPLQEYSSPSLLRAHQDAFKTGRSFTNESKAGVLDDVTTNTKSVTDDIMAMFSGSRASPSSVYQNSKSGRAYPNGIMMGTNGSVMPNGSTTSNGTVMLSGAVMPNGPVMPNGNTMPNGTKVMSNGSSIERVVQNQVVDDVTIDTKLVTDDIMAMFSGSPAHNHSRVQMQTSSSTQNSFSYMQSMDGTSSQNGGLRASVAMSKPSNYSSIIRNNPSSAIPSDSVNAVANYKWDSGNQVHQNRVLQTREIVSVRIGGTGNLAANQSSGAGIMETATKGSMVAESSKSEVAIEDLSNGNGKLSKEVGGTPSRKRSSWSNSVQESQCIYISDEEDVKVDCRENKKRRGAGVKESRTPVLERSLSMREKQRPSQYSPAIGSAPIKDMASLNEDTIVPRNILEPTLSRTEQIKPGGQIYPWDQELISSFLKDLNPPLSKYKGCIFSSKKYSGKVTLASLASTKSGVKNKPLELGSSKYQLKSSAGHGAFAQVYLAEALNKSGDSRRVVLKVQKPPCPWEFYIYRQLDMRIHSEERFSYGCAQNIHVFADCSFMECDFGQYGTLQDVINSYLSKGQRMDEPLCIFYTIEMLQMLENLHKVGLIHGDFKPDNLLIRSSSAHLGVWTPDKPGSWKQQGVCLIDWGRSIDLTLFAEGTEFVGDSKTDGFRCTEMIEKKPWTFQVDTYGLCGVAHCLLHGSYMEIEKRSAHSTSQGINRPKAPYKRYWNVNLWQNFFETLLNLNTDKSYEILHTLRRSFEDYLGSDPGLTKKLRELLVKQNTMLQSRK